MSKRGKGWYTTTPGKGKLPTLGLLPKSGGTYRILKHPQSLPAHWNVENLVGCYGVATMVMRQWSPPYKAIFELQIETSIGPLFWRFVEDDVELQPQAEPTPAAGERLGGAEEGAG